MNDYDLIISNKKYCKASIKGKSLVYNQVLNLFDIGPTTKDGITYSLKDNILSLSGKGTGGFYQDVIVFEPSDYLTIGHKYFVECKMINGKSNDVYILLGNPYTEIKGQALWTCKEQVYIGLRYSNENDYDYNEQFRLNMIDLTELGMDNINSVIEFIETDFGQIIEKNAYLPYSGTRQVNYNQLVQEINSTNWNCYSGTPVWGTNKVDVVNAIGRDGITIHGNKRQYSVVGNKYFVSITYKSNVDLEFHAVVRGTILQQTSQETRVDFIQVCDGSVGSLEFDIFPRVSGQVGSFTISNIMCINLTNLGLDSITTLEQFYETDIGKIAKNGYLPSTSNSIIVPKNTFINAQTPFRITKDIMYNNFLSFGNGNITDTSGNIVITDNKDGSYTINGNNTSSNYSYAYFCSIDTKKILNHKIIFGFMNDVLSQTNNEEKIWFFDGNTGDKTKNITIKRFTSSNDFVCDLQLKGNYDFNNVVVRPFFIDLTILGLYEITTREDFYKTYLGKLVLSCASLPYTEKNIAYGKNLFNVYEGLDVENIEHSVENGRVEVEYSYYNEFGSFCKQYIKVKPNTKYTFNCDYIGGNRVVIAIYDNDKNNISGSTNIGDNLTYLSGYSGYYGTCENNTFTTPSNCEYVRIGFCKMNDVGLARWNIYSHIKLEEGNCKTNYTRYEEDIIYSPDPSLKMYKDRVFNTHTDFYDRKNKLVSASSLSWYKLSSNDNRYYTYSLITEIKIPENWRNKANITSTRLKTIPSYDIWRDDLPTSENVNTICVGSDGFIGIKLDGSTTLESVLEDHYILYEIKNPTKGLAQSIMIPRDTTSVICENGLELEIVKN